MRPKIAASSEAAPADRLQQVIHKRGHRDLARQFDQVDGEPKSKDRFVRQDVGRRGRGVAREDKMGDE